MKLHRSAAVLAMAVALSATLGAGCFGSNEPAVGTPNAVTEPTLRGIVAGDSVILQEANAVVDGKLVTGPVSRQVTLQSFNMGRYSDATWELKNTSGEKLASGSWNQGALNTAHPFYLPGVFDSKTRPIGDASMLWLARQEYLELKATSGTTINPRFVEIPEWSARTKVSAQASKAYSALVALIGKANKDNQDLTYARLEPGSAQETIKINGKDVSVPVVHLRNWFGTYTIVDRQDNPLVLSFKLDPKVEKKQLDVTQGDGAELSKLVNYQVKEIVYLGQ